MKTKKEEEDHDLKAMMEGSGKKNLRPSKHQLKKAKKEAKRSKRGQDRGPPCCEELKGREEESAIAADQDVETDKLATNKDGIDQLEEVAKEENGKMEETEDSAPEEIAELGEIAEKLVLEEDEDYGSGEESENEEYSQEQRLLSERTGINSSISKTPNVQMLRTYIVTSGRFCWSCVLSIGMTSVLRLKVHSVWTPCSN